MFSVTAADRQQLGLMRAPINELWPLISGACEKIFTISNHLTQEESRLQLKSSLISKAELGAECGLAREQVDSGCA